MMKKKLSIVVPCYCEEDALPSFYNEMKKIYPAILKEYDFEILFVDDGSTDDTLKILRELVSEDEHISYLSLSRNFGKESAMYAGLCNVNGDYIGVMDVDLQDPPSLIPQMLVKINEEGYDCVATRRVDRKGEPFIRSFFAKMFYKMINKISDAEIMDGARDFRIMKRNVVDAILSMGEYNRFSKGIFGWVGFKTYWITYENTKRVAGQSKWNFWGLFRYAFDGIVNFSQIPLSIASGFGLVMTIISMMALIFIVVRKLLFGDPVAGWASTICVIIIIGGLQLFCLGIIGHYIAKLYLESKKRPHFIVAETNKEDAKIIL